MGDEGARRAKASMEALIDASQALLDRTGRTLLQAGRTLAASRALVTSGRRICHPPGRSQGLPPRA